MRRFYDDFPLESSIKLKMQKSRASSLRFAPQTDDSLAGGLVVEVGRDQRPQFGLFGLGERADELFPRRCRSSENGSATVSRIIFTTAGLTVEMRDTVKEIN